MATETEKIISQYREVNRGDVALGRNPNQQRSHKQRFALRGNIEPGDLFNKSHPSENYQFSWCPFTDVHYYHDCKSEGYKPVIESEWILARDTWEWQEGSQVKWRWSVERMLVNRDEFLMYRDENLWRQEQDNREQDSENSIKGRSETAMNQADRLAHEGGVEVELEANGKPNKAGVRRTIVS